MSTARCRSKNDLDWCQNLTFWGILYKKIIQAQAWYFNSSTEMCLSKPGFNKARFYISREQTCIKCHQVSRPNICTILFYRSERDDQAFTNDRFVGCPLWLPTMREMQHFVLAVVLTQEIHKQTQNCSITRPLLFYTRRSNRLTELMT